jgi:4-hydroxy-tetrahydrodipicolinate synthase
MAQSAEKSGADALMMVTPYYNKTSQSGLIKHFNFLADRVNLPIILYNVPGRTGLSFTAATYKELSKHPNINGVKEASGNISLIGTTLANAEGNFFVWSGNDEDVVSVMALGALGIISVAANIIPSDVTTVTRLCLEGDFRRAAELHLKNFDLIEKLFIDVSPMPVKAALNLMGFDVGEPRMPLCDMAPENLEKLRKSMTAAGLL